MNNEDMERERESIIGNAEGLKHYPDDVCFRTIKTIVETVDALTQEERYELAEAIKNLEEDE
jgi:NTP pyrophosphatase (non-canonical NTP hydrolase)